MTGQRVKAVQLDRATLARPVTAERGGFREPLSPFDTVPEPNEKLEAENSHVVRGLHTPQ